MVITILDSGGNVVMLQRMDGTQLGSVDVARDKAWSAVAFRRPTKVFEDAIAQGGANLRLLRLTGASPIEGGIPLMADGKIIGAIGVSGGTAPQDGQVAKAGVDGLKWRPPLTLPSPQRGEGGGQNSTGRAFRPRRVDDSRQASASSASKSRGIRRSSVPSASWPSTRASGAPRQK